jgi:hypothetical protein
LKYGGGNPDWFYTLTEEQQTNVMALERADYLDWFDGLTPEQQKRVRERQRGRR